MLNKRTTWCEHACMREERECFVRDSRCGMVHVVCVFSVLALSWCHASSFQLTYICFHLFLSPPRSTPQPQPTADTCRWRKRGDNRAGTARSIIIWHFLFLSCRTIWLFTRHTDRYELFVCAQMPQARGHTNNTSHAQAWLQITYRCSLRLLQPAVWRKSRRQWQQFTSTPRSTTLHVTSFNNNNHNYAIDVMQKLAHQERASNARCWH